MTIQQKVYPFTAIVEQEKMKLGLILNVINPKIGGILIRGQKGTAKSTAVRGLAGLLPEIAAVSDCKFRCHPTEKSMMCQSCMERLTQGDTLPLAEFKMKVVDLPVSATEDRVVGTLDIEQAIKKGEKKFEPGILAEANRNILYVDEVNLLDDHIVDVLLDSAAMGVNTVEREGVSYSHPARFILIGTMNPEEGDLRPQLLDRFGLAVEIEGINDVEARMEVVERRLAFEADAVMFEKIWEEEQQKLKRRIINAQKILPQVTISRENKYLIVQIAIDMAVDGHRADITMMKTATAIAAFNQRQEVTHEDIKMAAELVLLHRMRRKPFEETGLELNKIDNLCAYKKVNKKRERLA